MDEIKNFVNRYNKVWNEPDADQRRRIMEELWCKDASHFTENIEAHGYDAIEIRIQEAYEEFVEKGGFRFELFQSISGHHNVVKFYWKMVPQDGGIAAGAGSVVAILNQDGRIISDYQFTEPL